MAKATCVVDGCARDIFVPPYCSPHYQRLRNTGDVQADKPVRERRPTNLDGVCQAEGCTYPTKFKRYCPEHRQPLALFCVAPGCAKLAWRRDLCSAHSSRLLRHGDLRVDVPVRGTPICSVGDPCSVAGCRKPVKYVYTALCMMHDARLRMAEVRADPERLEAWRAYQRAFKVADYAKDPERHNKRKKDYKKVWDAANPEKAKANRARRNNRRRIRMLNAPKIPFTNAQLADRMRYWGNRCWICHGPYDAVDHVKPISKGGYDALANLRPICLRCNTRKGAQWPFPLSTLNPPRLVVAA